MDRSGAGEISKTDPDSRAMMNHQKVEVCYNIQMGVDSKYKLIADVDVAGTPADQHQLHHMAKRVKDTLGVDELKVLADKGYYEGPQSKR